MSKNRTAVGIELFAGCGGLSTGFLDAGLRVAAAFELDARAVDAYRYNHVYRGSIGIRADLRIASGAELLKAAGLKEVDFVIGGPPCQPFSIVGKRRGNDDHRSELIDHFIRLIEELNPRAFLFENVPNLASIDDGAILDRLLRKLRGLGYGVRAEIVAAADYGVPQLRRRLIAVGIRGRKTIEFPEATHGEGRTPYRTARDAIGDLPDAGEFGETGIYNHEPTDHSAGMIARLKTLGPGQRERGSFHDRLHPDRPSYTLRAGSGNFSPLRPIHYAYDRVITVRESARIQGFSDKFIWPDWIPRLQQYRQVGNAVPPPLARALAQALAAQLEWKLHPTAFSGDASLRPPAMTLTDQERKAQRKSRTRGASLGRQMIAAE
jgi:DNA (cytosine-5)-methyltransferase 1